MSEGLEAVIDNVEKVTYHAARDKGLDDLHATDISNAAIGALQDGLKALGLQW